jgi:TfoX/Sxy family transcriptional regulator of competence genes
MGYSEELDVRIRKIVGTWENTSAKKMFGGVCHLLNGNMFGGVYKDFLILRLGEKRAGEVLNQPFVKPFDITGKPMKGWVMVAPEGYSDEDTLKAWLEEARTSVGTLAAK